MPRLAPKVAIVNEAFAKKFNLGREAVGKHMSNKGGDGPLTLEIVGLVQDAKYSEVKNAVAAGVLPAVPAGQGHRVDHVLRAHRASIPRPWSLSIPCRRAGNWIDPNLPVEDLRTLPQQVRENVFLDRLISVLSAAFACLATLLACDRAVRRAGLHRLAAHARDRLADGARRAAVTRARDGHATGRHHDDRRRRDRPDAAIALGRLAQSLLFELTGIGSARPRRRRRLAHARRARGRLHPRASSVAGGSDAGPQDTNKKMG